jgi:hypothetical protein
VALDLEKLQHLESVGLVKHFEDNEAAWRAAAKEAYDYIKKGFGGNPVRPDDVIGPLKSVVGIDKNLRDFLNSKRLGQKYWILYFTELVIDRCWNDISS